VGTWNLWWRFGPWEERLGAIAATMAAIDADIWCLQEVWSTEQTTAAHVLAEHLGVHVAVAEVPRYNGVGFTNAVVSRWPIREVDQLALPGRDGPGAGPRRALWTRVEAPHGDQEIVTTHFDYRFDETEVRQRQARALAGFVADHHGEGAEAMPVVVGGDLNAVPDAEELRLLTGRSGPADPRIVFSDVWTMARADDPGLTGRAENPYLAESTWPNRRIDYLLVSWPRPRGLGTPTEVFLAGLEPVDGVQPSDHAAVVADLRTP
jgi:endonuclease/exonuclease/phosphatase family metal-dependent hydrolase